MTLAIRRYCTPSLGAWRLTISRRVALAEGQVGSQDGIVEHVKVGGHAVVAFVIIQHLWGNGESISPEQIQA